MFMLAKHINPLPKILAAALFLHVATALAQTHTTTVPFIGCASDGQVGPLKPPHGTPKRITISARAAQHLAWYQAENSPGVLAPRGWHCFGTYGSNGSSLFVAPQPLSSHFFFSHTDHTFTGPVIQISSMFGDTSGRFSVASTIARVFPAHRDFAESVRNEHLGIDVLPTGPAPTDKLHYLSNEVVEYTTPANSDGEGTHSLLSKSPLPITGVEILSGEELNCTSLAVRLPPGLAYLAPEIIHELERRTEK